MILAQGTTVASTFELLRPLGGRVYLARDKVLQREVALKFQKDGADGRAALLAEAAILARCDHPGIVQFYRTCASAPPEPAFYAMKAYPSTLSLTPSRHSSPVTRHCAEAMASALTYLHGLSPPVAHGDVTPDNILVDTDGHAVLAGFGSARTVADSSSPELAEDVYALGVLLRDAFGECVPREWKPLIGRMLSPDYVDRPSAAEVADRLAKPARGRRHWLAIAAVVIAGATAWVWLGFPNSTGEEVVEETISPAITAIPVLQPRLPPFNACAMGRIPWNYHVPIWHMENCQIRDFNERVAAYEGEHPDRIVHDNRLAPGAVRIFRLPGDVQIEMAGVPSGYFRRGFFLATNSPERAESIMAPETVLIGRNYWIARNELTRAQYAAVMRHAPAVAGHPARRLRRREGKNGRPLEVEGGDLPVGEDLDLADVERFIDALNALCKLEGDRRLRLPTEAEWEYACRAFVAHPFEGEKNWGDAAWTRENSGGTPHPVAQKAQNPLGLFDMHGNLAEWCADAYGPLETRPAIDPFVEPASNSAPRVIRGGSFRDDTAKCDSNFRASALPTDKGHAIRLVAFP